MENQLKQVVQAHQTLNQELHNEVTKCQEAAKQKDDEIQVLKQQLKQEKEKQAKQEKVEALQWMFLKQQKEMIARLKKSENDLKEKFEHQAITIAINDKDIKNLNYELHITSWLCNLFFECDDL